MIYFHILKLDRLQYSSYSLDVLQVKRWHSNLVSHNRQRLQLAVDEIFTFIDIILVMFIYSSKIIILCL